MTGSRTRKSEAGFTIVELVVVIVIIGILAATALPRFLDLTTDAYTASTRGVGGALASGVNLAHARWLADGGTATVNTITLEGGTTVGMTTTGWPENDTGVAAGRDTILDTECVTLWGLVMQNPPSVDTVGSSDYQATVAASPTCTFTRVAAPTNIITYDASTGAVAIAP